ncbi:MAG: TonB-dependent receptor [Novosphingobium sp.]|uniref:TonB-dependent receptor domain-containing protein n=1 Tax=Novosphingobium sp. TaxID=1874826 RepID=UPI0032BDABEB
MNYMRKSAFSSSTCLRGAAFAVALLGFTGATAAQAQDGPGPDSVAAECVDADNNGSCDPVEPASIVVTGSRIKRDTFNSASPITVLTHDDTTVAGFDSSGQVLQGTAVTAGARQIDSTFAGFLTDGGAGANTLSLRSLGPARTLILLNGRRLAPSGTSGSVLSGDLNVLPNAMVDRIEILRDGASSIYGSDAIAGVVNVVTDRKFSGLMFDGGVSIPTVGEGTTRRLAIIGGFNTDRLNISGSLEIYDRANLSFRAHDYLACQTLYTRANPDSPFGSGDFNDPRTGKSKCYPTGPTGVSGVTVNTIGTSPRAGAAGGPGNAAIGTFNRFRYNPAAGGSVPGWEGVNGGGSNALGNRDTVNGKFFDRSLISPTTNYNAYLQGSYDLNMLGGAELYADALFTRRNSSQRQFFQAIIDYAQGSPLIPVELQFSNIGPNDQLIGNVGVRLFSSRNYTSSQRVEYTRFGGGLRGSLPFSDWTYDFYAGHSYNYGEYELQQPITSRLRQSQNVILSGGNYVCVDTSNGCVAAPLLTGAVVNGDIPQAYLDFIAAPVQGRTKFFETTFSAQFAGSLFELQGGKIGVALGAEHRRQRIDDQPPIEQQTGQLYNYSTSGITQGKDSVTEFFGELELPLLRDVPFVRELTVNGSTRYTDYASYGSGWTYKFGGVYSPFKALAFRGTYGTSFRAPGLSEQFRSPTAGFLSSTTDPCYQYGNGSPTSTLYINCLADGVPINFALGGVGDPLSQSVRVLTTGGSQTGLAAETSKNWTIGTVIQPNLPGRGVLEFSADYFNIEVNNGVALFGGSNILQSCYNDPGFRSGTNGGELCQFVTRDASTSANPYRPTVVNGFINISDSKVRGLDFNLRFTMPIGSGQFRINAGATRYLEQSSRITSSDPLDDDNGEIYQPKWTGTMDVSYEQGAVRMYYGLNWVGKMDSNAALGLDPATSIYLFDTPDYFTHNVSLSVKVGDFRLTAGVKNLLDQEPPQISAFVLNRLGNSPQYSGYDFVGRTLFVNFTAKVF